MAIRVKHNVLVQISADTAGDDKRYYPKTSEQVIDNMQRELVKGLDIQPTIALVINFQDIDLVKGMYLEVDNDVDLLINGSATVTPVNKSSTAAGVKARFFMEGAITSLTITNPDATLVVTGVLVCWGDPTA